MFFSSTVLFDPYEKNAKIDYVDKWCSEDKFNFEI